MESGAITIDPTPAPKRYTTSAVDLTLGDDFRVWNDRSLTATGATTQIDLSKWNFLSVANGFLEKATTDANGCLDIAPYRERQSHYLAQTREWVHLSRAHKIAARVEGKSSLARIGLVVHLTAPVVHCGFHYSGNRQLRPVPSEAGSQRNGNSANLCLKSWILSRIWTRIPRFKGKRLQLGPRNNQPVPLGIPRRIPPRISIDLNQLN